MSESILGKENITKLFLKYSIPNIAGMLFLGLNVIVDGYFVGNYIGSNALASVNISMPFFTLVIAMSVIIGVGAQSIIGQKLGAGDIHGANDTFKTAINLVVGVSLLLAMLAIGFTTQIAVFLGANEQLMSMVTTYISNAALFLPILEVMFILDYVLKLMGKPIYSMLILVVAIISHMLFSYIFIAKLALGIKGAAIATGLGYCVSFIMAIFPFIKDKTSLKLFKGNFNKTLARKIIYNGSSEGVAEIGAGVTTFLFNITLMDIVGEAGVAAFTAISYLAFIGNNILLGLSEGIGAIVSYNYGSGKMARVKKVLKLASFSAMAIGVGLFAFISIFNREIIAVFLDDTCNNVFSFAVAGAELYAFAFIVNGLNIVASGYFTAISQPKCSALIALSKGIVWIGIGIVVLPKILGLKGIWLTVPIAEMFTLVLSATLVYIHFKQPTINTKRI